MGRAEAANVEGEQARPRSSLKLGKYQLLAVLGRGGMAEVFLALSRGAMGFDKLAVIKRLRPGLADDENFRTMFLDEARLAARLNHPNVVHTYEVGEHEGVYYIAMEYLEGQPLNKIAHEANKRGAPLDPVVSARIISDALLGLHHAHTLKDFDGKPLQIIHRDISPHNLFVTYEGTTKLVDFGIAKAALSSTETEVGVLKGKVAYMSPEQATGEPLDPRSDLFAMGIVLWELLTQKRLMTGDSAAAIIHRLMTMPVPPASSLRPEVEPALDAIVGRSLEKDPERRFPSALAMREAIEAYLSSTGRTVRNEEIGEQVAGMFVGIREAIQKQIQHHVEGAAQGSPAAVAQGAEMSAAGEGSQGQLVLTGDLPMLMGAGGGSSSGVVSRAGSSLAAAPDPAPSSAQALGAAAPTRSPTARIAPVALLLVAVAGTSAATQYFMGRSSVPGPAMPVVSSPQPPTPAVVAAPTASAVSTMSAPAPGATPSAAPVATTSPTSPPSSKGSRPPRAAGTAAVSPDSVGFFTFDTYPWTRVTEGGAVLGNTPLVRVPLREGVHTLTLDNADQSIHQTYVVTIKSGEAVTKRLGLK